jgi:hypothetical protein
MRPDRVVAHRGLVLGPTGAAPTGDAPLQAILSDVVALANGTGGDVVACGPAGGDAQAWPLLAGCVRAAALVARLAREAIDPPVPRLEVRGVELDAHGRGLLVLRVPASRVAPHRLAATGRCYVRRDGRTHALTVPEAQVLAFDVARATVAVDRRLIELRRRVDVGARAAWSTDGRVAVHVAAAPARDAVTLERRWLWARRHPWAPDAGDAPRWRRRPVLRGLAWHRTDPAPERVEVYVDGAVCAWGFVPAPDALTRHAALASRVARLVEYLRCVAGASGTEYAIEVGLARRPADRRPVPRTRDVPLYRLAPDGLDEFTALLGSDLPGLHAIAPPAPHANLSAREGSRRRPGASAGCP